MAPLARLKRRAEFLKVAGKGRRWTTPGFILQALIGTSDGDAVPRVGFTASRKVGIAVVRNRARRRLKEVARRVIGPHAAPGDYVMVARDATATREFSALLADVETALKRLGAWRPSTPDGGAE